jgi:AraC-like DNA-binding protein
MKRVALAQPSTETTSSAWLLRGLARAVSAIGGNADHVLEVLDRALLDLPDRAAEPGLLAVLDRYAEGMLLGLPPPVESFLGRVRRLVADGAAGSAPSLGGVARRLHMSARTLQRRLDAAGTSFQALSDAVRLERAAALLADPALPLAEVAFRLGFSGASAFHRAFRKWTGTTPLRHRRAARRRASSSPAGVQHRP